MAEHLDFYLQKTCERGASDLFLVTGSPVFIKKGNQMIEVAGENGEAKNLTPKDTEALVVQIYEKAKRPMPEDGNLKDDDFAFTVAGLSRFRVNTYRQRGSLAAVLRAVPFGIPDWREKRILPQIMELAKERDGLVLVTGAAGSGKSTTLACILNQINLTRCGHIITLEDPIEYLHYSAGYDRNGTRRNEQCIVSQREVSIDTKDYPAALRACLRQAPNVILLGEMRDQETIQTAMTAAETGHLVLATLHTKGAVNTVDRIVDSFPGDQQEQIRAQLSMVLRAVVSQQLLTGKQGDGESVPAFEVMLMTPSISALIRDPDMSAQISNAISNPIDEDREKGMISMDQSILNLYREGAISAEEAHSRAYDQKQMEQELSAPAPGLSAPAASASPPPRRRGLFG